MSSFAWFRLLFARQRNQFVRWIPLMKYRRAFVRPIVLATTLSALPGWLIVRAREPVEYANETNRPTNLAVIVKELDTMFDKEQFQEAFDYIEKNKNNPLFQSHYIQWRIGRIYYKLSLVIADKQKKRKLVEAGYEHAKAALQNGNHISSVHKWYGILLNAKSEYVSSSDQIRCAYEVFDHFEEACRLNPQDPTAHHCLGTWYWEVSQIAGWKRSVVKMLYTELPRATVHDALKMFLLAEEIEPGFYSKNLLMIVKCYIELNSRAAATEFAKLLLKYERKTKEDEEVHQELLKLMPRIERLLPYQPQASFSKHI